MNIFELVRQILSTPTFLMTLVVLSILFSFGNAIYLMRQFRNSVQPYAIAVIGLPRSGKTTLITSIFQVIFFQKFLAGRVAPRGAETIDRVNQNLETIQMGRSLGPTTEQDMFAYRADYLYGKTIFKKTYRLAIGDFAGEYSDRLADDVKYKALYETTFFKWVMEADAFIFVLDLASYIKDKDHYLAKVGSEFRSVWQRLVEYHLQGEKNIRQKKVAIVINKCDLAIHETRSRFGTLNTISPKSDDDSTQEVWRLGFGANVPKQITLDPASEEKIEQFSIQAFKQIIEYFKFQSNSTQVIVVSSFANTLDDKSPLGIKLLIQFMLPQPPALTPWSKKVV